MHNPLVGRLAQVGSFLLLAAFFLLPEPVAAQTVRLSLSDAIQLGLERNYGIRIAKAGLDAVAAENDWSLAGRYPTISLGLNPTMSYRNTVNPASIVSSSSVTSYGVTPSATVDWTLFNGGRVRLAKDQLETLTRQSEGQLALQVEASVQAIIQAYYQAVVHAEQVELLEELVELSRDRVEFQQLQQTYGQSGSFDRMQQLDAYLNDSISLERQQLTYRLSLRNLLQLIDGQMDRPAEVPNNQRLIEANTVVLTTPLNYEPTAYGFDDLLTRLESSNKTLANLRLEQEMAALQTRLVETESRPSLGLNAGLSYDINVQTCSQTFDFGNDQPRRVQELPGVAARTLNGNLGLRASYLLYDGGARRRRQQAAQLRETAARLNYESNEQQLQINLANAYDQYQSQRQIVELSQSLIDNARQNLSLAETRRRGGTINSFDYRTIQLAFISAEFQHLQALLELKVIETELLRLTGGLVD